MAPKRGVDRLRAWMFGEGSSEPIQGPLGGLFALPDVEAEEFVAAEIEGQRAQNTASSDEPEVG